MAVDECQEFFDNPPQNEANTCVWVILPLLYASGYARREVVAESADSGGKFPDYTLLPNDPEHKFYLEAKAWRKALEDSHANQAINYANQNGKRWVLLSNGCCWRLYDNDIRGLAADKLVAEMRLENAEDALRFLTAIGKESVCANRLPEFASAETDRRKREDQEKKLREENNRWQGLLQKVLGKELKDEKLRRPHCTAPEIFNRSSQASSKASRSPSLPRSRGKRSNKTGSYEILRERPREVCFLPLSWAKVIPENGIVRRNLRRLVSVVCHLEFGRNKSPQNRLSLTFSVRPMNNAQKRLDCLKVLKDAGFKIRDTPEYSQFFNITQDVFNPKDKFEVGEAMVKLLTQAMDQFRRAEAALTKVFK